MGMYHSFETPVGTMYPEQFLEALTNRFGIEFKASLYSDGCPANRHYTTAFSSKKYDIENQMCFIHFGANNGRNFTFSVQRVSNDDVLNSKLTKMFTDMVHEFGGMYVDDLTNRLFTDIGFLNHENGVAYFLKAAFVNGLMKTPHEIMAVAGAMYEFYIEFKDHKILEELKRLKAFMNNLEL